MTVPPGEYTTSPKLLNEAIVRRQISQSSSKTLGLQVRNESGPIDPDDIAVDVRFTLPMSPVVGGSVLSGTLADGTITREEQGVFVVEVGPSITSMVGLIDVDWTYTVQNQVFTYTDHYEVLDPMPIYESMSDAQKMVIEQVTWMMGDLFDSTTGGPHLVEEFQTHYGYERLAQLLIIAVNRINTMGMPLTNFVIGEADGQQFPDRYNGILTMALYIETIRHFIRSYVEQPVIQGGAQVAFADRRDYMQRWQAVLQDEMQDFQSAVRAFKRKQLNLGSGSFIVSGGIFGAAGGGRFVSGQYAAQTRGARFMATSFVLPGGGWGSGAGAVQQ